MEFYTNKLFRQRIVFAAVFGLNVMFNNFSIISQSSVIIGALM